MKKEHSKKIEEMLEPKLPRGINLLNVAPAWVFIQNVKRKQNMMNVMYHVEVYEMYPDRLLVDTDGPLFPEEAHDLVDQYEDKYPSELYEVLIVPMEDE